MAQGSIHVVGGAGGIGRWFIEKAFDTEVTIYCYDVNQKALKTLPERIYACKITSKSTYEEYASNFQRND